MRVVMFSRFPNDTDQPRGGVESATVALARAMARRAGIELHIVTYESGLGVETVEQTPIGKVHRLNALRMPSIIDCLGGPGWWRLNRYIRSLNPDVVHFQETYGLGGPLPGIPTVFTVHGFDSLNIVTERGYASWLRAPAWALAERRGIAKHTHLVSIAPYVSDKLRDYATGEVTLIHNALSPEFFNIERNNVEGRLFYAGWINSRKNLVALLEAVVILRQKGVKVSLHAAGEFSDEVYSEKVREFISNHQLQEVVTLQGRLSHQQLRKELSEAEVFVLPSLQENAPMAIAEAMAAGVPVVASNVCGIPTMVTEGKAGFLIDPNNYNQIADRLQRLLEDEELRHEMSVFAKKKSFSDYHPDSIVDATLAIYDRARSGEGGR